jgi:Putative bacterial sensory transduction regulator
MSESVTISFTPALLRDAMQQVGYRVELVADRPDAPYLRSATGGIPFEVRFINRMPGGGEGYVDVSFIAALRIQSETPLALVNDWNNTRRFGRLRWAQNVAVLDMDVSTLGGLTQANLQAQIAIWDQLLQDVVPFLRDTFARIAASNGTPQGMAAVAPPSDAPASVEA